MRPIHLTDLDAVVRVLLAHPDTDWAAKAEDIIGKAKLADTYRKRFRKPLVGCGTGTLSSAVSGQKAAKVDHCNQRYRRCLAALLVALD